MPQPLPLRANLDWLKKASKERLAALRAANPGAKLSDAQLAVAREYGFPSWRKLKAHVEALRSTLDSIAPPVGQDAADVLPDDPQLAQLLAAVHAGDATLVERILRERPILARAHGPRGQTALHVAGECDDGRLGVILLAFGADPQAKFGQSGHTALSWALTCNALDFGRTMLRTGVKPDLFCAAGLGALDAMRGFFDRHGELLPGAATTGSSRFDSAGSRLPCPPASTVEQISDALCFACRNGQTEVVRFLLYHKPDLSFRAYLGGTALHWAYFGASSVAIELVEKAGAARDARDDDSQCTPRAFGICVPANWGFVPMVERWLNQDPTLLNFMDGRTSPLHAAARGGQAEVVRLLLERSADRSLRDGDDRTALDVAIAEGHERVAELLR